MHLILHWAHIADLNQNPLYEIGIEPGCHKMQWNSIVQSIEAILRTGICRSSIWSNLDLFSLRPLFLNLVFQMILKVAKFKASQPHVQSQVKCSGRQTGKKQQEIKCGSKPRAELQPGVNLLKDGVQFPLPLFPMEPGRAGHFSAIGSSAGEPSVWMGPSRG